MRSTVLFVCLFTLSAFAISAQGTPNPPGSPGQLGPGMGPGMPNWPGNSGQPVEAPAGGVSALKEALSLTDGQITQLRQIQRDRVQANGQLQQQIQERQQTLAKTLAASSADAATVGNIVLDAQKLRKLVQVNDEKYHNLAVNVLTADQKKKLQELENAIKLRPAIGQAIGFGLLTSQDPVPGLGIGPMVPRSRAGMPGSLHQRRQSGGAAPAID